MKFKINKGFIAEKIEGKTIIYDEDKSFLYTFNETASYIFKKIKKGESQKQIVESLAKQYQIKENKAKKDYKNLVAELLKNKIILS